jgi:hypothetical protein
MLQHICKLQILGGCTLAASKDVKFSSKTPHASLQSRAKKGLEAKKVRQKAEKEK